MTEVNLNQTLSFSHTQFVLFGFPGVSTYRPTLLILLLPIYLVIVSGNSLVIYRIWVEKSLQSPMYTLIALLLLDNLLCATAVMPKFLLDLSFHMSQITLTGCLTQMFTIYLMATYESCVLLLMALDRYMAICKPLRYHDIMTNCFLVQLSFIGMVRSILLVSPLVILASKVQFCRSNIILNFACENMGLLNLGCGDMSKTQIAGLTVRILITVVDVVLLFISYSNILYTAMKTAVSSTRHKALHTCGTHLLVFMSIYIGALSTSIIYRLETYVSHDVKNLCSAMYLIMPATVNPFIYGFRVTEIRTCLLRSWRKMNLELTASIHDQGHTKIKKGKHEKQNKSF
ncbi:olfactory receptor 51E2-like [Discoglossus pictus]